MATLQNGGPGTFLAVTSHLPNYVNNTAFLCFTSLSMKTHKCHYYGSERRKLHFRESSFEKFPRGTCPRNPLEASASPPAEPLYPYFQMLPKTLFGDLKRAVPHATCTTNSLRSIY